MNNHEQARRVLLADSDQTMFKLLHTVLAGEGYQIIAADKGSGAFTQVVNQAPVLVIVNADLPEIDGYNLCRQLRENQTTRKIPIMLLSRDEQVSARIAGFEAGADDFLVKPVHPKELAFRIRNLIERHAKETLAEGGVPRSRARIIAYYGTKGGVGKTTLSINFATALCQRGAKRVALMDGDFVLGTVGVGLDLPPTHTIFDLADHLHHLDEDLLAQVLMRHSSGLQILQSPASPEQSELITADHVRQVLNSMANLFDYVVVDCQANYDERVLTILEMADNIVYVTTPEIHVLKNGMAFFQLIKRMKIASSKFQILLNRADSNQAIKRGDIESALKHRVDFEIRSDGRALVQSANHGVPLVLFQPRHAISLQMLHIADTFLGLPPITMFRAPEEKKYAEPLILMPKTLAAA